MPEQKADITPQQARDANELNEILSKDPVLKGELDALTGREKAAILLISLGADVAAKVYRELEDRLIEQIALQISDMGNISPKIKMGVLNEFQKTVIDEGLMGEGGVHYVREILERAMGPHRASDIIAKIDIAREGLPFDFIRKQDPGSILNFIQNISHTL